MPILNVLLSGPANAQTTRKVAKLLSDLTASLLHKKPELTSIAVRYVDPEHWVVCGRSLAEQERCSAYVEIKITDETNTRAKKAAYIWRRCSTACRPCSRSCTTKATCMCTVCGRGLMAMVG